MQLQSRHHLRLLQRGDEMRPACERAYTFHVLHPKLHEPFQAYPAFRRSSEQRFYHWRIKLVSQVSRDTFHKSMQPFFIFTASQCSIHGSTIDLYCLFQDFWRSTTGPPTSSSARWHLRFVEEVVFLG